MSSVPSLLIRQPTTGVVVSEMKLRRDAGELCLFADVLSSSFPYFSINTSNLDTLFGKASGLFILLLLQNGLNNVINNVFKGVEILLEPKPNTRYSPTVGDTRIFITATYINNAYTGYAYAIRPSSSSSKYNTTLLRTQIRDGNYSGPISSTCYY